MKQNLVGVSLFFLLLILVAYLWKTPWGMAILDEITREQKRGVL